MKIKHLVLTTTLTVAAWAAQAQAPFTLPKLNYSYDALEPHIDKQTMEIHHSKHHQAYVTKLNEGIKGSAGESLKIEEIMASISRYSPAVRNNGGGHYNHTFFWETLTPKPKSTTPTGALADAIKKDFGTFEAFKDAFNKAAVGQFGSGWVWLIVSPSKKLMVTSTPNQDNPIMDLPGIVKGKPIIGIDVWEHAYYLKFQNKRNEYMGAIWNVIDWEKASQRYEEAMK